ncbi:hypothetical protein BD309DRAFT_973521, partial [Dichomitus squalens]
MHAEGTRVIRPCRYMASCRGRALSWEGRLPQHTHRLDRELTESNHAVRTNPQRTLGEFEKYTSRRKSRPCSSQWIAVASAAPLLL